MSRVIQLATSLPAPPEAMSWSGTSRVVQWLVGVPIRRRPEPTEQFAQS